MHYWGISCKSSGIILLAVTVIGNISSLYLKNSQYIFIPINKNKTIPLFWFGKYLVNNIKLLDEKYIQNDYIELFDELYREYNLNKLNNHWNKLIIANKENINKVEIKIKDQDYHISG